MRISNWIIKKSFNLAVSIIESLSDMKPYREKIDYLQSLPPETLGKDIANCLNQYNLNLIPGFESHDLKHVLLDYKMTPTDEIRLQAFMIGNGNISLPSIAILLFGSLLLPIKWRTFYSDFKFGKKIIPISEWTIDEFETKNTEELRNTIIKPEPSTQKQSTLFSLTRYGAFASIFAGAFGMLFCLPFLFSSSIEDLVGAGFPFIGGAILVIGGLIALSNLSRNQNLKKQYA